MMSKAQFVAVVVDTIQLGGKRSVFWVILLALLSALLEAVGVGSVMPFIAVATNPDIVERNHGLRMIQNWIGLERAEFVIFLGVMFAVATIVANIASATNMIALSRFGAKIGHTLSSRLLRNALARPYAYFLNASTAEISALVLTSTRRVSDGIVLPSITLMAKGVSALCILVVLLWTDAFVAFCVVTVMVPIYGLAFFSVRGRLNDIGADIAREDRNSHRFVQEALSGVKDLKILGRTDYISTRFEHSVRSLADAQVSGALIGQLPKYLIETIGVLTIVGVILWGLSGAKEPGLAVSIAALYAFAGYRLLPAVQAIFGSISIIRYNADSLETVTSELWSGEPIASNRQKGPDQPTHGEMIRSEICLKNVTFTYPGAATSALDSISIEIQKGTHVGIVGPSGSGKSTMLDVLVGLLFPQRGGIYIDGSLMEQGETAAWRSRIGYVPQSVFLSDASIAENIAFGIPSELIDQSRMIVAARAAQIDEFIVSSLPDAYETIVGERGIRLSGGQRQRLGIARAMYHDPELLILDEATNALDSETESDFMNTIKALAGSRTVISVAHRLTSVHACDRIYVVANGGVVAAGRYDELKQTSPEFRALIKTATRDQE